MIRLPLIIAGGVVAAAAAVTPAVVGLTGNPSFSQHVPVRVPAHATVATFPTATASADGHEHSIERGDIEPRHREVAHRTAVETRLASPRRSAPEPGDDRGRAREPEPGDDRGRAREPEPGDDRGRGLEARHGDDRGHGHEESRGRVAGSASSGRSAVESENDRAAVDGGRGGRDDGRQ